MVSPFRVRLSLIGAILSMSFMAGCPVPAPPAEEPDPYTFADYWPMAIGNSWTFAEKTPHGSFDSFDDELSYTVVDSDLIGAYTVWHLERKDLKTNATSTFYVCNVDGVIYSSEDFDDFGSLPTVGSGATAIQADEYPKTLSALSPIYLLVQDFDLFYTTGKLKDIGYIGFLGATQEEDQPFELNDFPVDADTWVVQTHDPETRLVNNQPTEVEFTRTLFAWGVGPLFDLIQSREFGALHARVLSKALVNGVRYRR
ncbi:MAG: hypothetical protein K1Y02_08920 [Candidatus Hydrogenedentes bacterium]|nr:hypothetical protein [Candidatus Hydrogenedentota bacterium]